MTPEQSRAVARWYMSEEFKARTIDEQFAIRDRAAKGWSALTIKEQAEALAYQD